MDTTILHRAARDLGVLATFVGLFCEDHHGEAPRHPWTPPRKVAPLLEAPPPTLCEGCRRVLGYAVGQRLLCTMDPKPDCKKCPTPCYREEHRRSMRTIMRYSGLRLLLRGHFEILWKYFF